jgi:hypothetical protein
MQKGSVRISDHGYDELAVDGIFVFKVIISSSSLEHRIDLLALADIGDDRRIGTAPRQVKLIAVVDQSAVNRPSELLPQKRKVRR